MIRKVLLPEGKGKKPAFEYMGPEVENMELTDAEKRSMPSTRQKNSLLALGKNLAQLPDRDEGGDAVRAALEPPTKRARSLSGDCAREEPKLRRTMSVGREGSATSLLELGEVCERERERIQESKRQTYAMKPPTPVRSLEYYDFFNRPGQETFFSFWREINNPQFSLIKKYRLLHI